MRILSIETVEKIDMFFQHEYGKLIKWYPARQDLAPNWVQGGRVGVHAERFCRYRGPAVCGHDFDAVGSEESGRAHPSRHLRSASN